MNIEDLTKVEKLKQRVISLFHGGQRNIKTIRRIGNLNKGCRVWNKVAKNICVLGRCH